MAVVELPVRTLTLEGALDGVRFEVEVTDGDVIEAVRRYGRVDDGVVSLLRIGASAALAASSGLDIQILRRELDRAVLDASSAVSDLHTHIRGLVEENGPLATTMERVSSQVLELLRSAIADQADPSQAGTLLSRVAAASRQIDETIRWARSEIARELQCATDRNVDQLSRAVRQLRETEGSGPLAQAIARVEQGLTQLTVAMAATQARTEERNASTAKGRDYEDYASSVVAEVAAASGDRAERTGDQPGAKPGPRGASKRGDVTCRVAHGARDDLRIAIEIMNRDAKELTAKNIITELVDAMENRGAKAAIAVVSSPHNPAMCDQPLVTLADNLWAISLPMENASLIPLQVAYRIARQGLITSSASGEPVDIQTVRSGIQEIGSRLKSLEEARAQLNTIGACQQRSLLALGEFDRDLRARVASLLTVLASKERPKR